MFFYLIVEIYVYSLLSLKATLKPKNRKAIISVTTIESIMGLFLSGVLGILGSDIIFNLSATKFYEIEASYNFANRFFLKSESNSDRNLVG